jgi:hypothetical protein
MPIATLILYALALGFFILAGCNVTGKGRFQFQWLAFACLVAVYLIGWRG